MTGTAPSRPPPPARAPRAAAPGDPGERAPAARNDAGATRRVLLAGLLLGVLVSLFSAAPRARPAGACHDGDACRLPGTQCAMAATLPAARPAPPASKPPPAVTPPAVVPPRAPRLAAGRVVTPRPRAVTGLYLRTARLRR